jgi:tetratricopeptide (TPR) repeat protein
MGDLHYPAGTKLPLAQRYFDQGLVLAYGFNHAEAARSFREAQKLDPGFAMSWWGEALVLGPNINAAMEAANVPRAWQAAQRARVLAKGASPSERALIEALAVRYAPEPAEDRSALDRAYADAMRAVARQFPDDAQVQTLFAEALMDTMPWDYWQEDDEPKPALREVLTALERAVTLDPSHPGANHLHIHAVEAVRPRDGEASADRLNSLVPGAGHLVHMPSHIYIRVGRYGDAVDANERAIASDDAYVTQCHEQGMYPLAYMPHNQHFLWYAASMEGRAQRSLDAARHVKASIDPAVMRTPGMGTLQHFYALPYLALARFGHWEAILAEPAPAADLHYPTGLWLYARGMALTRSGRLAEAAVASDSLWQLVDHPEVAKITIWDINAGADILQIAHSALAGELALAHGDAARGLARLREAVLLEDALNYDEPPPWYSPARQALGAALLDLGRGEEAERVHREDLERVPENGWSLFGLAQALDAQGHTTAANSARTRFEKAWSRADTQLARSGF